MRNHRPALAALATFAILAGCSSAPSAGGRGRPVSIRDFDDRDVAPSAAHMDLGIMAEAILAEQLNATEGYRLVLPGDKLEKRRLAFGFS